MTQTNVRIVSARGYNGGEWYCAPDDNRKLAFIQRTLDIGQAEEPNAGWRVQTRGVEMDWHDWHNFAQPSAP